jgi:hypothetical protein
MRKLINGAAAVLICAACAMASTANAAPGGKPGGIGGGGVPHRAGAGGMPHGGGPGFPHGGIGPHGFGGGARGFRGFPGGGFGIYPYPYYGDYGDNFYPDYPVCDYVWVKRIVNHKTVRRLVYTCS